MKNMYKILTNTFYIGLSTIISSQVLHYSKDERCDYLSQPWPPADTAKASGFSAEVSQRFVFQSMQIFRNHVYPNFNWYRVQVKTSKDKKIV